MSAPWLRRLFNKRFAQKHTQPVLRRLNLEFLEDRSVPAVVYWTGAAVPDVSAGTDANGNALLGPGSLRWSNAGNWLGGQVPTDNDDVVFPAGTPTTSTFYGGANSRMDMNITISSLTILNSGYIIISAPPPVGGGGGGGGSPPPPPGPPAVLNITGAISANYSGTSEIHFDYRLSGNAQQISVGTGATLVSGGDVSNGPDLTNPLVTASQVGILKVGGGTLSFVADKNITFSNANRAPIRLQTDPAQPAITTLGSINTFNGVVAVDTGLLVVEAARTMGGTSNSPLGTLDNGTEVRNGAAISVFSFGNGASLAESLVITGDGLSASGALNGDGSISGGIAITGRASIGVNRDPVSGGRNNLNITGVITGGTSTAGAVSLTKVGDGILTLSGANTFLGDVLISQGILRASNDAALSPSGGIPLPTELNPAPGGITTVANGATLELRGDRLINTETLILNGAGATDDVTNLPFGALYATTGGGGGGTSTAEWGNKIILASDSSIGNVDTADLILSGPLFGTSTLTKLGQGTATFPNNNPNFSGNVIINEGVVVMPVAQALGVATPGGGGGPASTITVRSNNGIAGTLRVQGTFTAAKGLNLNGLGYNSLGALRVYDDPSDGVATNVTWAAPWTIQTTTGVRVEAGTNLLVTGVIDGGSVGANIERNGTGTLQLSANNTFLGALTLREGVTIIDRDSALGTGTFGGTTVAGGATLRIASGIGVTGEALTLSGSAANPAVLEVVTGNSSWTGQVNALGTNGGEATLRTLGTSTITFSGVIAGDAAIDKDGTGEVRFTGTTNSTNTGTLRINDGSVLFNKSAGLRAVGGNVIVGDGAGANNSASLKLNNIEQIQDTRDLTVNADGLFNLNGFNETIRALSLTGGEVLTGTATLTIGGDVTTSASSDESIITGKLNLGTATRTFTVADGGAAVDLRVNAVVSGGTGVGIVKAGTGNMVLGRANTYTGSTTVSAGTLTVGSANALPNSPLVVNGGTFDANGFAVTVPQFSGTGGALVLGNGSLTFGSDGVSPLSFAGTVSGSATSKLTKLGGGIEIFNGNSAGFLGTTNVNAGEFRVAAPGSLGGSVVVASGAILAGTGTVGKVTANGTATVSPGDTLTPGTLTTTGNVTLAANTQLVIDVATAATDNLTSSGTVNLGGAKLVLRVATLPSAGTSRTIVSGSSVTGTLRDASGATLNDGSTFVLNGRIYRVNYTGTQVNLTFVTSLVSAVLTSNNNPALPTANVTFNYTASAQNAADGTVTGSVEFFNVTDNVTIATVTLTGGAASTTTAFASTGTRTIEARYTPAGGSIFAASTSTITQMVNNTTTTVLSALGGPVSFGTAVALTATVSATSGPTPNAGTVQFVNTATGAVLGSATLNASGVATASVVLPAGKLSIAAKYLGTADFRASQSAAAQKLVTRQTLIATGAPAGSNGVIQVLDGETRQQLLALAPFGAQGTKVAVGDVDNDGFSDLILTQAAAVANPTIGILSGRTLGLLGVYQASGFTGGINIAAGDVNGDGAADVIVGSATNGDLVRVYSGFSSNVIGQFNGLFGLTTGVTLAAGDIDGNGVSEIIVGAATQYFFAAAYSLSGALLANTPVQFAQAYTKGVNVAAGDLDGDGNAEIVLGTVADSFVVTFDPQTQAIGSFSAGTAGGVSVSTADANGDGIAEILTSPTLGAPVIRRFGATGAPLEDLFGPVVGTTIAGSSGQ